MKTDSHLPNTVMISGIDVAVAGNNGITANQNGLSYVSSNSGQIESGRPAVKRETGQSAASILASYRRVAQQADAQTAIIPKRSTSILRPAKRKRHEDLVAFHRHSCQLFSSLDGTLAQIRMSTSSSSSSSSSSTSFSVTSPAIEHRKWDASLAPSSTTNLMGSDITNHESAKAAGKKPSTKRPTLQRMQFIVPPPRSTSKDIAVRDAIESSKTSPVTPISEAFSSPYTSISSQVSAKAHPPVTTTDSYCSSQNNLPCKPLIMLPRTLNSTTTIHWTSPETRRLEYAKIDAANSGVRLFLRRVFPRSMCGKIGGGREGFWNDRAEADVSDEKSVRRFRVSVDNVPDDDERISHVAEELYTEKGFGDGHCRSTTEQTSFSATSSVQILHQNPQRGMSRNKSILSGLFSCHL